MQPLVFLLLICLLVIAVTTVLCISFYFKRMQVWVREDDVPGHARRRPRWISTRNYQTFGPDLEAGPDSMSVSPEITSPFTEHARQLPQHAQQTPPTVSSGQGPSGIPRKPVPRSAYNYRNWDPEDGVIGVTYARRDEEDAGRILDEETARRIEEHERRMDNPSPYDLGGALAQGGSFPVAMPNKRTKRPTFPVPQKLIWQKLTFFEKAGRI
ncbi:uncharacterized protein TRUGW13939_11869 [Talaromyces rugulosus]|uniref:Uncharacterized protein n=1 Tax=Talaromyces rugulosus TaxID=121627 RepID=A0A7H8RJ72_TALRU|nr:uncharacterized protein TRUGW13939_11869 [Talaromyces rugulosus]QKX64693.1 hypothetical protein TRUGW13939_11869 [Talaromyces rugulosus]